MLLDDIRLKEAAEAGIPNKSGGYIVQPLLINHQPDITEIKPHEFIYSQFPVTSMQTLSIYCTSCFELLIYLSWTYSPCKVLY